MNKSVKIIKLDINELDDLSGVDAISIVSEPAIEENFMFFSKTQPHMFESYADYPDGVSNNAKRGIELNEKQDNQCATQVGKVRAQQLANKEAISVETIKRMYSYLSRAEEYYDESDTTACGTISYLLWGGLAGKRWAESKLKELGLFEGAIDVSTLPNYVNEPSGSLIVKDIYNTPQEDKEMVDGIVELIVKIDDMENRKEIVLDTLRDFAEEGVQYNLDDFLQRVGVSMSELEFVDNAGGFSVGDYVSWTYAGRGEGDDRARGQIKDLRVSGEVNVPGTDFTLTATEERPVALIETIDGTIVGQYTDNLRQIQKPENFVSPSAGESEDDFIGRCIPVLLDEGYPQDQATAICYSYWREKYEEDKRNIQNYVSRVFDLLGYLDGLPVFATPQEAEEVGKLAGCEGYHEHEVGEFIVYMPCQEHDPSMDAMLQEAYETWLEQNKRSWDELTESEKEALLKQLDEVAEDNEMFVGKFVNTSGISAKPKDTSFMDSPYTRIRYKYDVKPGMGAAIQSNTRDFCRIIIDRYTNQGKVFRKEDINNMSLAGVNTGFGPGPKNNYYDIFLYAGGKNCRHQWQAVTQVINPLTGKWGTKYEETKVDKPVDTISNPASGLALIGGEVVNPSDIVTSRFARQEFQDQQVLAGPFMIPDKLIYRYDEMNGEYYVYFPEDAIKKIAHKFMEKKYTDKTNIEHDSNQMFDDVFVVESWLVADPKRDKSLVYSGGKEYPKGTWYGLVKVKNSLLWNEYIKTGLLKGFSVEGFFLDELLNKKQSNFQ
jgi:hypothetical protein